MEELPNGFLNFPSKRGDFESAGDAIRKARSAEEYGSRTTGYRQSESEAAERGWQTAPWEEASVRRKANNSWGRESDFSGKDMLRYVQTPDETTGGIPSFDFEALDEIPAQDHRWSWVEVDLSAIQNNTMSIKKILEPGCMLMAIVKADGYGHGAVPSARTALNSGADYLGVSNIDEAIQLRKGGIEAPILILSEPPVSAVPLLLAYRIIPSIFTVEFAIKYAEAADCIGMHAPFHLKVNTGMNRIGVRYDEVMEFLRSISFHRALDLQGTYTHFATADEEDTMEFRIQEARFRDVISAMRSAGIDPGIVHAANSAAAIRYPEVHFDMVRVGLALYGYYPCMEALGRIDLVPAMSIHSRITQVKSVPVGEGVSYGLHYRSGGFSKICTVPIGYADGLRRGLSGKINFIMDDKLHPQVGNICMDQCMFEVDMRTRSGIGKLDPQIGDEVIIAGAEGNAIASIDEMAEILGDIPYELIIGFGTSRMPRIYK